MWSRRAEPPVEVTVQAGRFEPADWALALHQAADRHPELRARLRGGFWAPRWTYDGPGPHLRCALPGTPSRPLRPRAGVAFELVLINDSAVFRAHPAIADAAHLQVLAAATVAGLPR